MQEDNLHNAEAERFSNGVANLMMATEELRQTLSQEDVTIHLLIQWQHELESILASLESLARWTQDAVAAVEEDMYRHCRQKALVVAQHVLESAFTFSEPDLDDEIPLDMPPVEQQRRDAQSAIARITELNLLLYHQSSISATGGDEFQTAEDMVGSYVSYQRQVLRLRARPAIAELVQARRDGRIVVPDKLPDDGDDDDEDGEADKAPVMQQFHAPVLTLVLGDAAALIHPLMAWKFNLPPPNEGEPPIVTSIRQLCRDSIAVLDEQAQTLVKTVSDWFWEDRPIDEWMQKSAQIEENKTSSSDRRRDLAILDAFVEEMSFSCQVQARYQSFMLTQGEETASHTQTSVIGKELLPEWTWKYAALERFLAMQQWQSALELAAPVHIVLGAAVQVPSVVEDAQYLSTRALERAASTRSLQAIGTVAHAISHDVWSISEGLGVHQALLDQRGCWSEPHQDDGEKTNESIAKKEDKNAFASALLDALDEDMGPTQSPGSSENAPASAPRAAPSSSRPPNSGGFLSSLVSGGGFNETMRQMQLDTLFCVLNGIHAASGACQSLVAFLDTLLGSSPGDSSGFEALPAADNEKATAMIQLAREELERYAGGYQNALSDRITEALATWCGTGDRESPSTGKDQALNSLGLFLGREEYNLDAGRFSRAEADERLDRDLLGPLQQSLWFEQMASKCDAEVKRIVGEQIGSTISGIVLASLWESEKQFSDFGALLLSKQVRMLRTFVVKVASSEEEDGTVTAAPSFMHIWERLSQVVAVLQLEKPSDWLLYHSTSILTPGELNRTMSLRVDFSNDAVQSVVSQIRQQQQQ